MQRNVLDRHPGARLRVYAIWVDKLFTDARSRWDAAGLTDPRVVHLWDGRDVSGAWLQANVQGYGGSDWDAFWLFGPKATWDASPGPLLASGSPVVDAADDLRRAIDPLLAT